MNKLFSCSNVICALVDEIFHFMTLIKRALFVMIFHDILKDCESSCESNELKLWEKTVTILNYMNTIRPWSSAHDKHTRPYKSSYGHLTKKIISHATHN